MQVYESNINYKKMEKLKESKKRVLRKILILVGVMFLSVYAIGQAGNNTWNVIEYGGYNNGKELNTKIIQKLIDTCSASGGGTVYFPPGDYLTGAFIIKSNVTMYL